MTIRTGAAPTPPRFSGLRPSIGVAHIDEVQIQIRVEREDPQTKPKRQRITLSANISMIRATFPGARAFARCPCHLRMTFESR